jgi:ABC-2 type transport system ATP-binding protein
VEYFDDTKTAYSYFDSRETANEYVKNISSHGKVVIRDTDLEDCFVKMTGDSVGDQK